MIQDDFRHHFFLSWVLDQVFLLKIEFVQFKTTAFNFNKIKNTKKKFDVSDDSLKKRNFKKQKFHRKKISLFTNDQIASKIKMNEKKHQQILKYDEKSIFHNMIRRSKVKKPIRSQFD